MMKTIALLILTVIAVTTSAQNQVGIFAGPQATSAKYTIKGIRQPTDTKYGFHLGGVFKVPFDNKIYFAPSAFYSMKGYKVAFNQKAYPPDTLATDNNTTIHTFELAALLQVDFGRKANHLYVRGGPSLDFQLSGKEKFNLKNGTSVNRSMPFGFDKYGHYGANLLFQFGYETKNGFSVAALYGHGIGNINNADYGPAIHHRTFGLSIGKYLSKGNSTIDTHNKE